MPRTRDPANRMPRAAVLQLRAASLVPCIAASCPVSAAVAVRIVRARDPVPCVSYVRAVSCCHALLLAVPRVASCVFCILLSGPRAVSVLVRSCYVSRSVIRVRVLILVCPRACLAFACVFARIVYSTYETGTVLP